MMLQIGKLAELLLTCIILTICFIQQVTSQLTQPGHKYKVNVYLPEGCGEADFSGLYGVNLISQREGTYAKGQDCILHLRVPTGYFFNITFTHFDLEPPTQDGSCSDYLQLYNGHGTEMLLSEHLCGSKVPSSILSNTSEVTLRFHSDKQKEFTGFKLIYDRIEAKTLKELGLLDTAQQKVLSQNLRDDAVNSKSSSGHLKEGREGQQGSSLHKGAP